VKDVFNTYCFVGDGSEFGFAAASTTEKFIGVLKYTEFKLELIRTIETSSGVLHM
jgi:hypothetical protein